MYTTVKHISNVRVCASTGDAIATLKAYWQIHLYVSICFLPNVRYSFLIKDTYYKQPIFMYNVFVHL